LPSSPAATTTPPLTLRRGLGPWDAAAIVVSNVIGGGILFTPPQIAASVPNAILFLATWVAGGLLAFAGAMAYAELAALKPRAGGEYVYLRDAYGPLAAFLTGWTSFVAGFSGAVAVSAVVLADYLGRFVPAAGDRTALFAVPLGPIQLTLSPQTGVAVAAIVLVSLVHRRGVGPGRIFGNVLATLKVLALLLFIAVGFAIGTGSAGHFTSVGGEVAPASWLLALIPVMFSYSGWNAAAYVAEEIRDPGRNAPRALAIGTGAVVAIYLLLNLLYLYVFPVQELAAVKMSVLDAIADQLIGAAAGNVMAVVAIISLAASISAMVLAGPRVYYAMARDGLFFEPAARVHPRFQSPAISIWAQAAWSALLVLSGTAGQLVNYTGFAVLLFSGVAVVALFVLRRRAPDAERPFRAWGYPFAPAVFAISSLLIVVNAIRESPGTSGAGLLVIAAGIPLYLLLRRRKG
jgi:APA family basic amino acid/polyamine antiporter